MSEWILSIVASVLISSVITMLLPEGKLAKYVKGVFGIIIMFVIIQPIFTLKNGEYNLDFESVQTQMVFQGDYLNYVSEEKMKGLEEKGQKVLEEKGFQKTKVDIEYTVNEEYKANIRMVTVDLKNAVFIYDARHIDIIEDIIVPICKLLDVEEKQVDVIE